jgi:hypothetical protein
MIIFVPVAKMLHHKRCQRRAAALFLPTLLLDQCLSLTSVLPYSPSLVRLRTLRDQWYAVGWEDILIQVTHSDRRTWHCKERCALYRIVIESLQGPSCEGMFNMSSVRPHHSGFCLSSLGWSGGVKTRSEGLSHNCHQSAILAKQSAPRLGRKYIAQLGRLEAGSAKPWQNVTWGQNKAT